MTRLNRSFDKRRPLSDMERDKKKREDVKVLKNFRLRSLIFMKCSKVLLTSHGLVPKKLQKIIKES